MIGSCATRQLVLQNRPEARFRSSDMEMRSVTLPPPEAGQMLVRTRWLSLDPLIRIRISEAPLGGALAALPLGAAISGPGIAEVVESDVAHYPAGCLIEARLPWQEHAIIDAANCKLVKTQDLPEQAALGILGLPGQTAYAGMELVRQARPAAHKILVSGAAGAVGSLVAQLAKHAGLHVTGIAHGSERCRYLDAALGLDAVVDRSDPLALTSLESHGPFDVYFDNVGGALLPEVAKRMARGGLIVVCGLMSHYNQLDTPGASRSLSEFLDDVMGLQLEIRTFIGAVAADRQREVFDFFAPLLRSGAISLPEIITTGLASAPEAFEKIFESGGIGKRLVRIPA